MNNCGASEEEGKAVGKPPWGKMGNTHSHEPPSCLYFSYISQALLSLLLKRHSSSPLCLFQNLSSFAFLQPDHRYRVILSGKLTACSVHFKFDHHFPNENRIPFIQGLKRFPLEYGVGVRGLHHSAAFAHVWHHFGPAEVTPTTAGGKL